MYEYPLLWWDNIMACCESRPKQNPSANRYTNTENKERAAVILGDTELP